MHEQNFFMAWQTKKKSSWFWFHEKIFELNLNIFTLCHQSLHGKMTHDWKHEKCFETKRKNILPFFSFRFEQKVMDRRATDFLPFFGTDIGFCTMLKPQLSFNKSLNHLPYMDKMFGNFSHNWFISKGAKVGKANGNVQIFKSQSQIF